MRMCVCTCVHARVYYGVGVEVRTAFRSEFSFKTLWALGVQLRVSGLAASAFIHWDISLHKRCEGYLDRREICQACDFRNSDELLTAILRPGQSDPKLRRVGSLRYPAGTRKTLVQSVDNSALWVETNPESAGGFREEFPS